MQAWQPEFSPGILFKVKGGRCHLTSTHMPEQVNDIHNVLSRIPEQVNDILAKYSTAVFFLKMKLYIIFFLAILYYCYPSWKYERNIYS